GTNPGAYDYRALTTLSYAVGPATVSLTWTHLPSVIQASKAIAVSNNVPNSDTTVRTSSYELFNLAGNWSITDNLTIRAGIDNLFNKTPPITGANTGITPPSFFPTDGQGLTNATGTSSAFYYDVLGRRFYMGAKLKF
ncbi:MAG TPA: TonB-dependent receptor, partial [Alphaproteobacteria bacterium]|nr:TonB-dependent receptor [Alphaproteobacteria bacterium]